MDASYVWEITTVIETNSSEYTPNTRVWHVVADTLQGVLNKVPTRYSIISAVRKSEVKL